MEAWVAHQQVPPTVVIISCELKIDRTTICLFQCQPNSQSQDRDILHYDQPAAIAPRGFALGMSGKSGHLIVNPGP